MVKCETIEINGNSITLELHITHLLPLLTTSVNIERAEMKMFE